jgi:uncharacterized membrane protein YdbT with pleckstrin-like domain
VKKEKKKRTARIALNVTQTSSAVPRLTAEATSTAAARLVELKKKDDEKAATEEAKNTLEVRDTLYSESRGVPLSESQNSSMALERSTDITTGLPAFFTVPRASLPPARVGRSAR